MCSVKHVKREGRDAGCSIVNRRALTVSLIFYLAFCLTF